ncbi:MAG: elongation factor 4 [Deltaproteobacteria bacterium]|nr:elongation factor 4 [Deltaproteobacteria bacterium]
MIVDRSRIRNFSIIAHIDHGKSTLADRFLELTHSVPEREMRAQFLDRLDLERERGITIKAQSVRIRYPGADGGEYLLNLIDTPGHVDFVYEVSRSMAACEGVILLVDAMQGVQAQTVANLYQAMENDLVVIPVINKIDLPDADPERVKGEIEEVLGLDPSDILTVSAKEGTGVHNLLQEIIERISPPAGDPDAPLKALIFDSWYDSYHGAIIMVRVVSGRVKTGDRIRLCASAKDYTVSRVGVFAPHEVEEGSLGPGEVGFLVAGIKAVKEARVGDTVTLAHNPTKEPFSGFKAIKPMVFAGLYPADAGQYNPLREALERFHLNDSSFTFEPESSATLGLGFRCGFLGLLHMEIVQERLEREFGLRLIFTSPTVVYEVVTNHGETLRVANPSTLPSREEIASIREPFITATIHLPAGFLGPVLRLCEERRGKQKQIEYFSHHKVAVTYELPLVEVLWDFYDRLKSFSKGYASFDYGFCAFRESDLVRLDILINGEVMEALSIIVHRDQAYYRGKELVHRMKDIIPRQMFEVVVQAAAGGRIIARGKIPPLRKHVTAKCYGGDVTRKNKLLGKQREGKKRMKRVGKVDLPQEAFLTLLQVR